MSSLGILQLFPGFWLSMPAWLVSAPMALERLGPDRLLRLAAAPSRHRSSHREGTRTAVTVVLQSLERMSFASQTLPVLGHFNLS